MAQHWLLSYDNLSDEARTMLLEERCSTTLDPLHILLRQELEEEAERHGYDSVEDYLADNPEIVLH